MKKILLLANVFISLMSFSQGNNNIIPQPAEIKMLSSQGFAITKNTALVLEASGLERSVNFLNDYLQHFYGFKLKVTKKSTGKNEIVLNYARMDYPLPGAYTIDVKNNGIYISGDNETGVFYAIQTLLQLLPNHKPQTTNYKLEVPALEIKDHPRFPYRGMHLDVGRHFFPPSFIKKYIDYLALHKFNYFHWHLTEDQGWRIEIKKYPELTTVGGYRNGTIIGRYPGTGNDGIRYGGYYTQAEIKDIVKYAAGRYIAIIPEIEMPGHCSAAIAAYPGLSCFPNESTKAPVGTAWSGPTQGKQVQQAWGVFEDVYCPSEYTFKFLQDVMDEVIKLFPSKYIHIGGDECPKENWKRSEFCQKLIKDKGLKDEHGLQSYFIQRIEKYLNSKGRQIIGWDEILEGGLAPNATVMSWRGEEGGIAAAKQKHNVMMTPGGYCYFDHSQSRNEDSVTFGSYLPLETVYNYEPVPKQLNADEAKYVLGAQGNVWTEYMDNPKKVEYMIFPRMSALSEVLWSPKERKDWKDFERRLPGLFKRYELWGAASSTAYYDMQASVMPTADYNGITWKLDSKNKDDDIVINQIDTSVKSTTLYLGRHTRQITIKETGIYIATNETTKKSIIQKFFFNKATGKKITLKDPPSKNYPGSGAFTLVNGVITEKKLNQSSEWLGFLGKDMEAEIDLGGTMDVDSVIVNVLDQNGSWIYLPKTLTVEATGSDGNPIDVTVKGQIPAGTRRIVLPVKGKFRIITVTAKNYGIIPSGQAGGGNPAWLFVDEIEVK